MRKKSPRKPSSRRPRRREHRLPRHQFRLEKAFGIKIEKGEMFNPELANDPNFVQGDKITPQGIAELKTRMPFANIANSNPTPNSTTWPNSSRSR